MRERISHRMRHGTECEAEACRIGAKYLPHKKFSAPCLERTQDHNTEAASRFTAFAETSFSADTTLRFVVGFDDEDFDVEDFVETSPSSSSPESSSVVELTVLSEHCSDHSSSSDPISYLQNHFIKHIKLFFK